MLITANQSSGCGQVFGDQVIAAAILDRMLHHAILNIRGITTCSRRSSRPISS